MPESIQTTVDKISKLEVQGARNVAIAAIKALEALAKKTKAKNKQELLDELQNAKNLLFASRATEPLMRNVVRLIISQVRNSRKNRVTDLTRIISITSQEFLKSLEESKRKIAEIGARRITEGSVIFTHCHSSTVTSLFKKAKQDGKTFKVICTETRPLFQGRITVEEMLELGVDSTLIVDSAARFFMNQADFVVVGADAITSEGNVINKIGTSMIALAAKEARTPFYVVCELLKFDPATIYGDYEKIEERNPSEIWVKPPENLSIRNPAFDITRRDFIHAIICEEGIVSPHSITEVIHRKYSWILE